MVVIVAFNYLIIFCKYKIKNDFKLLILVIRFFIKVIFLITKSKKKVAFSQLKTFLYYNNKYLCTLNE